MMLNVILKISFIGYVWNLIKECVKNFRSKNKKKEEGEETNPLSLLTDYFDTSKDICLLLSSCFKSKYVKHLR